MIREDPASRGTETSAEVLVGPPWRMVSNAGQQQWYGGYPYNRLYIYGCEYVIKIENYTFAKTKPTPFAARSAENTPNVERYYISGNILGKFMRMPDFL